MTEPLSMTSWYVQCTGICAIVHIAFSYHIYSSSKIDLSFSLESVVRVWESAHRGPETGAVSKNAQSELSLSFSQPPLSLLGIYIISVSVLFYKDFNVCTSIVTCVCYMFLYQFMLKEWAAELNARPLADKRSYQVKNTYSGDVRSFLYCTVHSLDCLTHSVEQHSVSRVYWTYHSYTVQCFL